MPYPDPNIIGDFFADKYGNQFYWNATAWVPCAPEAPAVSVAAQSVAASTTALVTGSKVTLPPASEAGGGVQAGLTIEWIITGHPTTGAAVTDSWSMRFGPNGSTADASIGAIGYTGTAGGVAVSRLRILWTLRTTTPGASTSFITFDLQQNAATGFGNIQLGVHQPACSNITTLPSTTNMFAEIVLATGAGQVIQIDQCATRVLKVAN